MLLKNNKVIMYSKSKEELQEFLQRIAIYAFKLELMVSYIDTSDLHQDFHLDLETIFYSENRLFDKYDNLEVYHEPKDYLELKQTKAYLNKLIRSFAIYDMGNCENVVTEIEGILGVEECKSLYQWAFWNALNDLDSMGIEVNEYELQGYEKLISFYSASMDETDFNEFIEEEYEL